MGRCWQDTLVRYAVCSWWRVGGGGCGFFRTRLELSLVFVYFVSSISILVLPMSGSLSGFGVSGTCSRMMNPGRGSWPPILMMKACCVALQYANAGGYLFVA